MATKHWVHSSFVKQYVLNMENHPCVQGSSWSPHLSFEAKSIVSAIILLKLGSWEPHWVWFTWLLYRLTNTWLPIMWVVYTIYKLYLHNIVHKPLQVHYILLGVPKNLIPQKVKVQCLIENIVVRKFVYVCTGCS